MIFLDRFLNTTPIVSILSFSDPRNTDRSCNHISVLLGNRNFAPLDSRAISHVHLISIQRCFAFKLLHLRQFRSHGLSCLFAQSFPRQRDSIFPWFQTSDIFSPTNACSPISALYSYGYSMLWKFQEIRLDLFRAYVILHIGSLALHRDNELWRQSALTCCIRKPACYIFHCSKPPPLTRVNNTELLNIDVNELIYVRTLNLSVLDTPKFRFYALSGSRAQSRNQNRALLSAYVRLSLTSTILHYLTPPVLRLIQSKNSIFTCSHVSAIMHLLAVVLLYSGTILLPNPAADSPSCHNHFPSSVSLYSPLSRSRASALFQFIDPALSLSKTIQLQFL